MNRTPIKAINIPKKIRRFTFSFLVMMHRRYEKMIVEACQQEGFEPRILAKIDDTRAILLWANTGMGVAIVPKDWLGLISSTNLKYREIDEATLFTRTAIAWKKNKYLSALAKHFLETFELLYNLNRKVN